MHVQHKPNVYSYVRFSTPEQRKGTGQARQTKLAEDWCQANGYKLFTNYADLGVSAYKGKNSAEGQLGRFLALVEDGKIAKGSVLLVESLDRISRQSVTKALPILLNLINSGITVVTLCDGMQYSQASCDMPQLMMSLLIFARANDESKMKSQRKAASWAINRKQIAEGKALVKGRIPTWLAIEDGKYVIIDEVANKIRQMFADYTNGYGLWQLQRKYDIPKPTLGTWLNSPAVIGDLVLKEGEGKVTVKGHYPAIIEQSIWNKAQTIKAARFIKRQKSVGEHVNLFSGILTDHQGKRLDVSRSNANQLAYYTNPTCGYVVRMDCVERSLLQYIWGKLVIHHYVESEQGSEEAKTIRASIEKIQKQIASEPEMMEVLLPILRDLRIKLKDADKNTQTVTTEQVDHSLHTAIHTTGGTKEQRLQAREIIRENIKAVKLLAVEKQNRARLVKGEIAFLDGKQESFCFAYDTHRKYPIDGLRYGQQIDEALLMQLAEIPALH